MATANEIMRLVALRTGSDYGHVQELGRNLIMSGAWQSDQRAVVYLVLALLAGAEPGSATSVAKHYHHLQRTDEDGTTTTAGQMIEDMLGTFLEQARTDFSVFAYRSSIEVYSDTPAVRITTPCLGEPLERTYLEAHDSNTWQQRTVRRSTVLPGRGLFDIASDILMKPPLQRMTVPFQLTSIDGHDVR